LLQNWHSIQTAWQAWSLAPPCGAKLIIVLGHNSCGEVNATVAALQKGNTLPGHIADLVRAMKPGIGPALNQSSGDLEQRTVLANVRHNVEQLNLAKPILAAMVAKKEVRVVGGVYDLATGKGCREASKTRIATLAAFLDWRVIEQYFMTTAGDLCTSVVRAIWRPTLD
jgi:hypothetical protein